MSFSLTIFSVFLVAESLKMSLSNTNSNELLDIPESFFGIGDGFKIRFSDFVALTHSNSSFSCKVES